MSSRRGFTLIETMIVLAIVAIVAGLAYPALSRARPRARLAGAATDLVSLLRAARQNALSTGHETVVLVFPGTVNQEEGRGRILVREDPTHAFFDDASAENFDDFSDDFTSTTAGDTDSLFGSLDLPRGIRFGFGGVAAPTLAAPYANVPVAACSFCDMTATPPRGAIVFDGRGRAWFHQENGAPLAAFGGTIALQGPDEIEGYRLLVITAGTGGVRVLNNG